ncbi:MAG: hypothetical protein IT352_15410 [Gemmatimonadales bacterium]|nr:hypothetical protein [Gemmatimonadales bacterium]
MIGEVVLLHEDGAVSPAIVAGVRTDEDTGAQALELVVLGADFDAILGRDDATGEAVYGDRVTARAVVAPRGQPGKDSGTFWAPRG